MNRPFVAFAAGALLLACATPAALAEKIELTGTLRDFKARGSSGGHPDFEDTYNSQFPLITGMVKPTLGADGKPVLNISPAAGLVTSVTVTSTKSLTYAKLTFTDNSTYTFSNVSGTSGTFAVPSSHAGKSIKSISVKISGSSSTYTISDDADHAGSANSGKITANFAVDTGIPRQWRIASPESFKQWYTNAAGVNQSIPHTIVLDNGKPGRGGVYRFEASKHNGRSFFPVNGKLFGNEGRSNNYHFTYEIHTKFTYTDRATRDADMVFNFSGDDDVWVFINRKLVVDLCGVHQEKYGSVNVDALAPALGLAPGETHDFHFFFAERHTTESNCTIETTMQFLSPLYD